MKSATRHKPARQTGRDANRRIGSLLPLLVASASAATLIAQPARALELGEIQVESTLGQPLRASIAYALNPHEELYDYCVALHYAAPTSGLPALTRAKISVGDGKIFLDGALPIKEPLLSMRLTVDCPYTIELTRDYLLMIDPQEYASPNATAFAATAGNTRPVVSRPAAATTAETRPSIRPASSAAVTGGAEYRVQPGDTLSGITSRIDGRTISLNNAMQQIFAANPEAFIDDDINRLKAGVVLQIPFQPPGDSIAMRPEPEPAERRQASRATTSLQHTATTSYAGVEFTPPSATDAMDEAGPAPQDLQNAADLPFAADPVVREFSTGTRITGAETADVPADAETLSGSDVLDDTAVLEAAVSATADPADRVSNAQPGDVFVGADIPAHAEIERAQGPVPVVVSTRQENAGGSLWSSWIAWALGGALALGAGLFVVGRRVREGLGGGSAAPQAPQRRATDLDPTAENPVLGDVDFQFDDLALNEHDMVLDADLGAGTGFDESSDVDIAEDFGFADSNIAASDLDLDISGDLTDEEDAMPTDIIPPAHQETQSILDQEVMPDDSDDDDSQYDLSMIVDATKQPIADTDATAKDLEAVPVATTVMDDFEDDGYTLSKEVDYKVLEQDYEEEFTATQALNSEIEKAAMELAMRMDEEQQEDSAAADVDDIFDTDLTAQMPMRSADSDETGEFTSRLPAGADAENDDQILDLDDTGINEELTIREDLTAEMPLDDGTAEMPFDDHTVEMDIESGTVNTKKIAG